MVLYPLKFSHNLPSLAGLYTQKPFILIFNGKKYCIISFKISKNYKFDLIATWTSPHKRQFASLFLPYCG